MRSFFGCCELRTAVIVIAIFDLIFGLYEIIDFALKVFFEYNVSMISSSSNGNSTSPASNTTHIARNQTSITRTDQHHGALYSDSAFAIIVIGCIDLFISSFLLYVAVFRKYELRVVVFVAAIWGFVMAFLNFISFGITLSLGLYWIEFSIFLIVAILESFFGYVILSYFHFMTVVVERGLDEVNMVYYADEDTVVTTAPDEIQMDGAEDDRYIMDDLNEDYPEYGDDGRIPLT